VIGLGIVLLVLIVLLVATGGKKSKGGGPASTTTAPTTSTPSTTTSTSTTTTSTTTTSTTTTTTAPTTTAAPSVGTQPPTVPQTQQISAAGLADSPPACQVTDIFISNSDPTWAAVRCTDPQSQQAFLEVRQLQSGSWVRVSYGTAQVDCASAVPPNVQADFTGVLGNCPG